MWALAQIEAEMAVRHPSKLREIVEQRMSDQPAYWKDHDNGSIAAVSWLRVNSYSDRIR
ncbi:class II D-tagatose-bisphosphate aldolase non-catalytic subunit [Aliiroseovarius sp. CAU 1755]